MKISSLLALIGLYLFTINFLTSCGQKGELIRPVPATTAPAATPVQPEPPLTQPKKQ